MSLQLDMFRGLLSRALLISMMFICFAGVLEANQNGLSFEQLAAIRSVREVKISPDGAVAAYTLVVPRQPGRDEDGGAWQELHVVSVPDGTDRTFIGGEVKVSGIRFSPDGGLITYLAKRGDDEHVCLWAIPVDGGESTRLLEFETGITDYRVSPDGSQIAFVAKEPVCEGREKAKKKGYSQEVYEEDWLPKRVWLAPMPPFNGVQLNPSETEAEPEKPQALPLDGSVSHVRWSPNGEWLAVDLAPSPLVDDTYMNRRVHLYDIATQEIFTSFKNPGKLGAFEVSPNGDAVAMISAADPNDPAAGRLMVSSVEGEVLTNVLPNLVGNVRAFAWRDYRTLMFIADEGVETRLGEIRIDTGKEKTYLVSGAPGFPILSSLSLSSDGVTIVLAGDSPRHPSEVFAMGYEDAAARRLTDSNPWLNEVSLASQERYEWEARDGLDLGGVLIRPVGIEDGTPVPLIMSVHGGPEAHRRNGWLTSYSSAGQLAAARGYAVFYPNYRGSTGRGVEFSKLSQGDAAGKEFDDLVDAVEALVADGIVDKDRVGITGGSYGGYATAWCATRYSEHFRAGVMFVGISNKLSKGMTTEIPVEDIMVHTLFDPYTRWEFSLERSPIYHVEKSRTALLIAGGTDDSRVHPSQSLQLYRALKLIGKTPVRYVRYPGEGHGNRRAASRDDYARRLMRWMDHFVMEKKTALPPWELSCDEEAEPKTDDE